MRLLQLLIRLTDHSCATPWHPVACQVACLGLQPHKHLGRTIAALEPHLLNLNEMYGCNVCGEGGEYETLTLDCPMFTKGRIVLDKYEVRLAPCGSLWAAGGATPTAELLA